jgi:dienelactone hydrolase
MNGRNDHLVPVEDIKECERRMQEAGRRCDVRLYQGAGHAFFNYKKPSYESTVADIDTFLQSLGYID